ncbi:hypothetical protein HYW59_02725 [Candidatus Kaiserbacteria bacterium]|nr:hypothetical protein [Candidatus Kaiserbacteria bacterium]
MDALQLGVFAALLQVAGYAFYGSKILRRDIRPNAASWLMFAYGTSLLLVVEWDRDASFALLALPAACALSSIVVAFHALRKAEAWWPEHVIERTSFGLDILLTIAYVSAWLFLINGLIAETQKDWADIFILLFVNIATFTSFYPLLRQVYHHPYTEHATPWTIWTLAYVALGVATIIEGGIATELLIYPVTNIALHGWIAARTARWRYQHGVSIA